MGATAIHVWGASFEDGLQYKCSFGGTLVDATALSGTLLTCVSPDFASAGPTPLEVSVAPGVETSSRRLFHVYSDTVVTELQPSGGSIFGGTFVVVHGPAFSSGSDYRCRFGPGAEGEWSWVNMSVTAFRRCESRFGEEHCALSFESLTRENEETFYRACRGGSPWPRPRNRTLRP